MEVTPPRYVVTPGQPSQVGRSIGTDDQATTASCGTLTRSFRHFHSRAPQVHAALGGGTANPTVATQKKPRWVGRCDDCFRWCEGQREWPFHMCWQKTR